jgi:hypothetical protein
MKTSKLALLLLGCSAFGSVLAQDAEKMELTAEQIIDKHIEATGGRAAYEKQKSLYLKGTVEFTGQSIKGKIKTYMKTPDKILVILSLEGFGDFNQGYDGKIAWSQDPINGLQTLGGMEKARLAREAGNSILQWKQFYKSVEVVGTEKVGERNTFKVKFTPTEGKPSYQYFDKETFLVLRADTVQESAQATMDVQSYMSDYRFVGGVKMAFKSRVTMPQGEMVVQFTQAMPNYAIEDSMFAYPAKPKANVKPKGK